MEFAAAAVGLAGFGIKNCEFLLSYCRDWKNYETDISSAYESIDGLRNTLTLLKDSLEDKNLDEEKRERVSKHVNACEGYITKLSEKFYAIHKYNKPEGFLQKAVSKMQRARYPFEKKNIGEARVIANHALGGLQVALTVLQIDVSASSQKILAQVVAQTGELVTRTANIETSMTQLSIQNQELLTALYLGRFKDWLSPSDPWTNHKAARERYEPQTGTWLLQSGQYQQWKSGSIRNIWMYGRTGYGKTVLCSTAIEDVDAYCKASKGTAIAIFYFSFSDDHKQSYEDLLRSLIDQLGRKKSSIELLQQAYDKPGRGIPGRDELQKILIKAVASYEKVFLMLDALDECPQDNGVRQTVLEGLEKVSGEAANLQVFATSHPLSDVGETMKTLEANPISISAHYVKADIRKYLTTQISDDRKLSRLDPTIQESITERISVKADGMFRWAYCQLQELKRLPSTRHKYIENVLNSLPATLIESYERMLNNIDDMMKPEALALLRWLAYAQAPLSLDELAEVTNIDPALESVDLNTRESPEDTLDILAELISVETTNYGENTKVRLAHASVKDYLESKHIVKRDTKYFHLDSGREHNILAQSCLIYIKSYDGSSEKKCTSRDFERFPLLRYAAQSWYHHSSLQQPGTVNHEISLLKSVATTRAWLLVHQPDRTWQEPFEQLREIGSGIYYASIIGLEEVTNELIRAGADVNAQGGDYGNALQAASYGGYKKVVQMLIDAGADVNAEGGLYNNALLAASEGGYEEVVQMLIDAGADFNAQEGRFGNALRTASFKGYEKVVQMLIDAGADVHAAWGGISDNVLQAASKEGHEKVVQMLLDAGADVNAQGRWFGSALCLASKGGYEEVVQMLIDAGANVHADYALLEASFGGYEKVVQMLMDAGADLNAQRWETGNVLQAASKGGHEKVVQMLIDAGADVNAYGGVSGNALKAASEGGHKKVVQMLMDAGADVHARGGYDNNALQAASRGGCEEVVQMLIDAGANVHADYALQVASSQGHEKVVQMLIDAGADVNAHGWQYSYALQQASYGGYKKVVQMLMDAGADVNAQIGRYNNALQAASEGGCEEVVQMLIDAGADVHAQGGYLGNALQAASFGGYEKVVQMLIDAGADVHAQGGVYGNAMQAASEEGHEKVVQILMDAGADGNA